MLSGLFNFAEIPFIKQFTLHKGERLKKRKEIESLFKEGKSFSIFPLRVYYVIQKNKSEPGEPNNRIARQNESVLQVGVSVSKKHFKKAVHRNRIKRLLREAYRTQKLSLQQLLKEKELLYLKLFIIYTGQELPDYNLMRTKVAEVLARLEIEIIKRAS